MRQLVYYVAASIDGYIADTTGGYDAFLVEGDHTSAIFGEFADALPTHALTALGIDPPGTVFDTVILGWNTLAPALAAGISSPYAHLRQFVASRRNPDLDSAITVTEDALATVRTLKREPGLDIWLCGGGELAATLLPEIDRIIVKRHPIVFGSGIPLFASAAPEPQLFTLTQARAFTSGVVIEDYGRMAGRDARRTW